MGKGGLGEIVSFIVRRLSALPTRWLSFCLPVLSRLGNEDIQVSPLGQYPFEVRIATMDGVCLQGRRMLGDQSIVHARHCSAPGFGSTMTLSSPGSGIALKGAGPWQDPKRGIASHQGDLMCTWVPVVREAATVSALSRPICRTVDWLTGRVPWGDRHAMARWSKLRNPMASF